MRKGFDNLFLYLDIPRDKRDYVIDIVDCMLASDQDILRRKCGTNLDGVDIGSINKDEKIRIYSTIIPRIKTSYVTLSTLTRGSKEYSNELDKLRTSFSRTRKMGSISNLRAYFNNLYTYEELDAVIKSLKDEEQRGLYAVCGKLLDGNDTKEDTLTKEERSKVNTHYMPKVRSRLKKLYPERQVKDEEEEKVIATPDTKKVAQEPVVTSEVVSGEYPLISKVLGVTIKDNIGFTKKDYLDILKIFNSEEFKELTRLNLPLEEVIVASLIHHGFQGKRFSIEDLEKFLGISREAIIEIARRSTETYRQVINEKINDYEENLLKLINNNGE